ncbi:MAG: hypothetical protein ACRCX2_33635 [Paraclostridium sp.]
MDNLGSQIFEEYSEVDLFNKIGFMAETLGYNAIYFKSLMPKLVSYEDGYRYENNYMHYIHLEKDGDLMISIYYDEHNMGAMFPEAPYYELYRPYSGGDIERFVDTEEDRLNLLETLKTII